MHYGKGRMDLLPWNAIIEVSKHCEDGALKYGEGNVNKGIPQHSLIDSAFRHLAKYNLGMDDEDHLRAAAWNILWALDQRHTHPELDDRIYKPVNKRWIDTQPAVDVVRCKDCRLYVEEDGKTVCEMWEVYGEKASPPPFGYCYAGIRKECDSDSESEDNC